MPDTISKSWIYAIRNLMKFRQNPEIWLIYLGYVISILTMYSPIMKHLYESIAHIISKMHSDATFASSN